MSLLLKVDPGLIETGLWSSIPAEDAPFWAEGKDVLFRGGGVKHIGRKDRFHTQPLAKINSLAQTIVKTPAEQTRVFFGSEDTFYLRSVQGGVETITDLKAPALALTSTDHWSFVPYGNFVFASNGKDDPFIWKGNLGTKATQFLSGQAFSLLTRLGPFLVAGGITYTDSDGVKNVGNEVKWSDAEDVTDWTPTTTNKAGSLILRDLESDIRAFAPLGNSLAVYGRDSMGVLSYISGNLVIGFRRLLDNIGAVGPKAVVSVGYENYGFSSQGVWKTDGSTLTYIDEPALRDFIQKDLNEAEAEKIVAFHDETNQSVNFYYPEKTRTQNTAGIAFNYKNKTWSKLSFGFSAGSPRKVFSEGVVASGPNLGFSNKLKGSGECRFTTRPLELTTDPRGEQRFKVVRALRFGLRGDLRVRLGYSERREPYVFTGEEEVFDCRSEVFLPERECVYLTLQFFTDGPSRFHLSSILVEGIYGGELL